MLRRRVTAVLTAMALAIGSFGTGAAAYAKEPETQTKGIQTEEAEKEEKEKDDTGTEAEDAFVPEKKTEVSSGETKDSEEDADETEEGMQSENIEPLEEEELAKPDILQREAYYDGEMLRIAAGVTIMSDDAGYPYWADENCIYLVADDQIASVDSAGNITGKKAGETVVTVTDEDGRFSELPVRVTDVTLNKTAYTVFINDNTNMWNYPTLKVYVNGLDGDSDFYYDYGSNGNIYVYSYYKSEGYLEVVAEKSGTVSFTIDGKVFTITVNVVKAELSAPGTISKYLGSLVTYKSKKDTLTLKLDGQKKAPKAWKSMDTSIATVNKSGQVTGKNLGRTYIRAYLDSETYLEYLVECTYKGAYQAVSNGFHDYESGDGKKYKIIQYSQEKRMQKGYRDCSSFVSRCYYDRSLNRKIYEIANGGSWAATAAGQAKWLKSKGKTVANKLVAAEKLLPGDTMYTRGPKNNERWRDIYHAFMYVGNGCVLTTSSSDVKGRTLALRPYNYDGYNVVYIGRPLASNMKTKSISLSKKSVSAGVNEKYTLKATRKPADSTQGLSWSSSKKSVASVSSKGVVTAKKKGTAYITVKSGSCSAKCKVVVKAEPKKIKLNAKKKTLLVKKTFQIKHTLSKGSASGKIKYSSSNSKVAGVSSKGKITAKKKGTATITVSTYNNKTAAIKVKVK